MESIILTPRLKLTLLTTAERGTKEFEWLHEMRSNEQTTWWSISGRSKTFEDTEKIAQKFLPLPPAEGEEKSYRVAYAVHELLAADDSHTGTTNPHDLPSRCIGLVTLHSLNSGSLPLPSHLFPESTQSSSNVLTIELGYQYLPTAWGKGYAGESVSAVFEACKRRPVFWSPYQKVYLRAIVNFGNPASQRVMAKIGMPQLGVFEWSGEAIYLAGEWREKDNLWIYGKFLLD